jgi:hypothetical protein
MNARWLGFVQAQIDSRPIQEIVDEATYFAKSG